jgi:ankyrin repeat protein
VNAHAARLPSPLDAALLRLLRAIADGDDDIAQQLAASPTLATVSIRVGATREDAASYFLERIARYVYVGDTALHVAAAAYRADLGPTLRACGADVHARNRRGATPLHDAVTGSPGAARWNAEAQSEMVTWLLEAGANVDAVDATGMTPLHRAIRTRCSAAARVLIAHGANVVRMNKNGSTPLHLAVQATGRGGTGTAAARVEQSAIIRLLLASGASPADIDRRGKAVEACATQSWVRSLLQG